MANRENRLYDRFHTLRSLRDQNDRLANSLSTASNRTFVATLVLTPFGLGTDLRLGIAVAGLGFISSIELDRASSRARDRAELTQEQLGGAARRIVSELPR